MSMSDWPPAAYPLSTQLNVLLWTDQDSTDRPMVAISTEQGWHALTREQLWQIARNVTRLAAQHERDLGGTARHTAARLSETLQAGLIGRTVLDLLPVVYSATTLLLCEEARLGAALLDDVLGRSTPARAGVTLTGVAAALDMDEPAALDYLSTQQAQLDTIRQRADAREPRRPAQDPHHQN